MESFVREDVGNELVYPQPMEERLDIIEAIPSISYR
jgi:hypothetical protein